MESFAPQTGLTSLFPGDKRAHKSSLWRPWVGKADKPAKEKVHSAHDSLSGSNYFKTLQVMHPVKLYWPKSRCFDYLYQDAERLLRNYPVQATISPYEDSSSDDESEDEEEEEEEEKGRN
ncbi:hypothetical protein LDENG_00110380 [Lucifuga dentata]|nr:hypothetical protein LDENG_00110380 [Lucifuga dentata]